MACHFYWLGMKIVVDGKRGLVHSPIIETDKQTGSVGKDQAIE
jgi:hypothetical protein